MQVYKRGDSGKYAAHFMYEHPNGEKEEIRKTTPFYSKKGALAWAEEYKRQLLNESLGIAPKEKAPTLAEFAPKALGMMIELKPSSLKTKRSMLKHHLLPAFGDTPVDEITKNDIREYRAEKIEAGLKPKTVNNQVTALNSILSIAEDEGLLDGPPRVKRLPEDEPDFDFLTIEELNELFDAAEEPYRTMMIVAGKVGLRQSELFGLQWKDIDLDRGFLLVKRTVFRGVIDSTKNRKIRRVPLGKVVIDALVNHKHSNGPYVFCREDREPMTDNQCKSPIKRACRMAGIRSIGWHVLRHTYASHLVQAGVDIFRVSKYMGHSDVRVTMRYAHLAPDEGREAARLLDTYNDKEVANVVKFRR